MMIALALAWVVSASPLQAQDPEAPSEELKRRRAAVTPGKPVDTGEQLKIQTDVVEGLNLTRLGLPGAGIDSPPVWTPDGKVLFVLESKGLMRRIQTPSFREDRRVELGVAAGFLNRSREGLIVHVKDLEEVWVIDEVRLTVKTRLHAPKISSISSAPSLSVAFGSTSNELRILDLKKGGWAEKLEADRKWHDWKDRIRKDPGVQRLDYFGFPKVSPDGKSLFWVSYGRHWRAAIRGTTIEPQEAGPSLGGDEIRFLPAFSQDSQLVAFPYYGGNRELEKFPKEGDATGVYVFKSDDLQNPVGTVGKKLHVSSLCFDKAASVVYTRGISHRLAIWTMAGVKTHEFAGPRGIQGFMVCYPEGRRVLLQSGADVFWIELSESQPSNVAKDDPAGPAAGKPVAASSASAAGPRKEVDGLVLTEIRPATSNKERASRIVGTVWGSDGRSLYMTDNSGFLIKVSVPDLKEERRILVGDLTEKLALSQEGILTFPRTAETVWLLDSKTLDVKFKLPIPRLRNVVAGASHGLAICDDDSEYPILDLKKGSVAARFGQLDRWRGLGAPVYRHPQSVPLTRLGTPLLAPDGRQGLIARDGLHRFTISGGQFQYVEAGPPIEFRWIVFSPDSKYFAVGTPAARPVLFHPTVQGGAVFIYKTNYLTEPVMVLQPRTQQMCGFGFDPGRKRLVLQEMDGSFTLFGASGEQEKVVATWPPGHCSGLSLDMSPVGGTALVVNSRGVFLAEFQK